MKPFLLLVLLLAGGGAFYVFSGKDMIDEFLNPGPLPETIEVNDMTFMGDEYGNPYAE
jgi:hypothetical protein